MTLTNFLAITFGLLLNETKKNITHSYKTTLGCIIFNRNMVYHEVGQALNNCDNYYRAIVFSSPSSPHKIHSVTFNVDI